MTFGKWNNTGSLTWANGSPVLNTDLTDSMYAAPPIGTIMPWYKFMTGVPATLPEGWKECDGTQVSDADSPMNGVNVPDLVNTGRLIRGGDTANSTGGGTTHTHTCSGPYDDDTQDIIEGTVNTRAAYDYHSHSINSATAYPQNVTVSWIMRIK